MAVNGRTRCIACDAIESALGRCVRGIVNGPARQFARRKFVARVGVAGPESVAQNVIRVATLTPPGLNDNQATRTSMLVMTRGVDEAIIVGDMIIRVVEVQDDNVRLGIASPYTRPRYREVTLRREEGSDSLEFALPEALAAS